MTTWADVVREVELLEAELALAEAVRAAGVSLPGHRDPFDHELRAAVRFAELDRHVTDTTTALARRADAVRDGLLDELATLATTAADDSPLDALARLRALADPTSPDSLPGVRALVDDVAADVEAELTRLAERSGRELLDEAARQGLGDLPPVPLDPGDRDAIRLAARRVAEQPVTRGLAVALEGAERLAPGAQDGAEVMFGALEAVEEASRAGLEDTARQAAGGAQGIGRTRAALAVPRPAQVYASELLDGNTCGPCADVDGRRYTSLEAALEDYPGAGGFVFCEGGGRCRGTLVYVWDSEETPTVDDTPGPQGPSDPPGGPDGPIRPLPADDRTTFPRPQLPPVAPPLPAAPLPPTVPPAQLDTLGPDPALAELGDEALNAQLRNALADGDQAAAVRYADELDRRAALGDEWRDPDLEEWDTGPDLTPEQDAAEAARIAAAMEDAAPELSDLGLSSSPAGAGGRRIERVREDFLAEQHRRMLEAEHVAGIRADRAEEFRRKYGAGAYEDVLWHGPARTAYYYASEELREWWRTHPRLTFAEFAEASGVRDAKTLARAKAAREAREDAARRAEESGTERDAERRRQRQAEARRRRATGAGADLERARRRMEREQRRAAKAEADLERQGARREDTPTPSAPVDVDPPAPPPGPPVRQPRPPRSTAAEWEYLEDVTPELADLPADRLSAVELVVRKGEHRIVLEEFVGSRELDGLLADVDAVLDALPEDAAGIPWTIHVPKGDELLESGSGAYVVRGTTRVMLNPNVARGRYGDQVMPHLMPGSAPHGVRRWTIAHELGHILDYRHSHTRPHQSEELLPEAVEHHHAHAHGLGSYGQSTPGEGYAEAFAHWVLNGPGDETVDSYARLYGWS